MAGRRAATQHPMVRPMVRWKRYQWVIAIIFLGAIIVTNNAQDGRKSSLSDFCLHVKVFETDMIKGVQVDHFGR
ncbi:hypothetical protein OUZ56_000138 [Daphnia magna]|uniref:Uncharacterized protein n=1 Tax=Daphnia magna TaxID=35525 RepID=A0ABQ9ZZM4_9CRUS|nr:hypothetical protein OUZ56_000138 [Daphnia magna]